jgi:hypothetical protein
MSRIVSRPISNREEREVTPAYEGNDFFPTAPDRENAIPRRGVRKSRIRRPKATHTARSSARGKEPGTAVRSVSPTGFAAAMFASRSPTGAP